MKKYRINVEGCDADTEIERELTDSEYAFLKEIADEITKTSRYQCMPRMYVEEVETDE